jgi:hypothetical protein
MDVELILNRHPTVRRAPAVAAIGSVSGSIEAPATAIIMASDQAGLDGAVQAGSAELAGVLADPMAAGPMVVAGDAEEIQRVNPPVKRLRNDDNAAK